MLILLTLNLSIFSAYAQNEMLSDQDLKKKFVAEVKDAEVEGMLSRTKEFTDCFQKYKYEEGKSAENTKNVDDAQKCFADKLKQGRDAKQLQELSSKLNLETYGLVKSKNVADITEYLTDKIYKAMTGYSRKESDRKKLIESLKFGNRKMIDQRIFIDLYITQLGKSALQEMTRYCFEDLRDSSSTGTTFEDHWANAISRDFKQTTFSDDGDGSFIKSHQDQGDVEKNYQSILNTIAKNSSINAILPRFWEVCKEQLNQLCKEFEEEKTKKIGGRSCIVKGKLQEARKAIAQSEKVSEQFKKMSTADMALMLDKGQVAKFYDPTKDPNASIDKLTTQSSVDLMEGNADDEVKRLAEECKNNPTKPECEKFYVEGDSEKAAYDLAMQMNLKKEIEKARIKELMRVKGQALEDYLKENGYHELAQNVNDPNLEKKIGEVFEARKKAAIDDIVNKVGKRQASAEQIKKGTVKKEDVVKVNAEETLSERARLAQVVLFNNIILSSLDLLDDQKNKIGKNISGLEREVQDISSKAPNMQSQFFDNMKSTTKNGSGGAGAAQSSQLGALDLIDSILGKKDDKKPGG